MSQAINAGINTSNMLSSAVRETKGDELGKSEFLLLLVTQFKHQDPLNPMDDKEFVAQLSQFSSLEQLMNLNTSMDALTNVTQQQQMMNASSYIGKEVAASGNSISKDADGKISTYFYAFGENRISGTIRVYDQNMSPIYTETVGASAPSSTAVFEWNGKKNDGSAADPGVYYVYMEMINAEGKSMLIDSVVTGTVTSITQYDGQTYLTLSDGRTVALAEVRKVSAPNTANTENSSNADNDVAGTGNNDNSDNGVADAGNSNSSGDELADAENNGNPEPGENANG